MLPSTARSIGPSPAVPHTIASAPLSAATSSSSRHGVSAKRRLGSAPRPAVRANSTPASVIARASASTSARRFVTPSVMTACGSAARAMPALATVGGGGWTWATVASAGPNSARATRIAARADSEPS